MKENISSKKISEFRKYGELLYKENLIHCTAGNMSTRVNDSILITSTGSMLFDIKKVDIKKFSINCNEYPANVSSETLVHHKIYLCNDRIKAIIHAHPLYTTILSYIYKDFIVPFDMEGKFYITKAPIIEFENNLDRAKVADTLKKKFNENKIVVIKSHGVFACGETLKECFNYISVLENSSKIIYSLHNIKK